MTELNSNQIPLSLDDAQRKVDAWINEIGVRYFSELTNLAQLMEEVGELSRIVARTYGEQSFKPGRATLGFERRDGRCPVRADLFGESDRSGPQRRTDSQFGEENSP